MRLLIDLQGAQSESRYRGIGRYAIALAQSIARRAADRHEIWLMLNGALYPSIEPIRQTFVGLLPAERIRVFDLPYPVAMRESANLWRSRAAALLREDFIATLAPDAVLVTSLFEGFLDDACVSVGELPGPKPFTAVVHYDLIPLLMPEQYLTDPRQRACYQRQMQSLARADLLLAISEHTRQEALSALGIASQKVCTIMSAADPMFAPSVSTGEPPEQVSISDAITRHAVVCAPGGFDPRKNIERLIQAYALLSPQLRSAHQLVIASRLSDGQRRHLMSVAQSAGLTEDELVLTGFLSDTQLMSLYRAARLFVFPSLHEGFGLPVLEAMACGAPVIGSNTTSIPEVIGAEQALFDPHSASAIADTMSLMLSDPDRLAALRQHCLTRAATFSWEVTADRAIAAIELALASSSVASGAITPSAASSEPPMPERLPTGLSATLCQSLAAIDAPSSSADWIAASAAIAFHHPASATRQLFVDVSEIARTDARTGIQRVVRALLLQLLQRPPQGIEVVPVRFADKVYRTASAFTQRLLEHAGLEQIAQGLAPDDTPIDPHHGDVYFSLDLNPMTAAVHAAQLRLHALGVRCCFVVYDILPLRHPQWWPPGGSEVFANWLRCITVVADRMACISQAVADDLEDWLAEQSPPGAAGRTRSFHLGAEIADSIPSRGLPPDADAVLARIAARPSFLMVGTLEPRKGHAQVLAGFEAMWAAGQAVNLVIVGKRGWLVDTLVERLSHHPRAADSLFWLEGISDEYLDRVYAACTCLIAASEGEGFGLPLIEAARHGIPILARDIAVFREVAGDHALYFSGARAQDIQDAVTQWRGLQARGLTHTSSGMPWLTWEESAHQLLQALDLTTDQTPSLGIHKR